MNPGIRTSSTAIFLSIVFSLATASCGSDSGNVPHDATTESETGSGAETGGDLGSDTNTVGDDGLGGGDDSASDATTSGEPEVNVSVPWPEDRWISPTEVYERVVAEDSEMLLVNVSDEEFYSLGHIEGSLKIPWDQLPGRLDEVDTLHHVVLYCRRGVRTQSAYRTLQANDYELVWTMEGGLEAWLELEYPVVYDD